MESMEKKIQPFVERMRSEGLPEIVIETFKYYYRRLLEGQSGLIAESDIVPLKELPDAASFPDSYRQRGEEVLEKTILLKLNGGLGTSMGLNRAKSLLKVKDGFSFLDIIARQAIATGVPLVLMNSFNTRADSLAVLGKYPELKSEIPLDFVQHKVPKVRQEDYSPVVWPEDPALEWCPPGHGDIYTALVTSGMLDLLLEKGYRYAFVSNADNLGAVLDTSLLGYFAEQNLPFMMEAADRTEADKKGGHLAQLPDGRLILRESAQCPDADQHAFRDTGLHRYFNTNNLWLNLADLKRVMEENDHILGLPMIRNAKTINPRDSESEAVYQLETAMGAAIGVFENAGAVRVPRTRFAPVKNSSDLLAVRSDVYYLTEDYKVIQAPDRKYEHLVIELDEKYYKLIDEMEARFPFGPPSLRQCAKLAIEGNIKFGAGVILKDRVQIINDSAEQAVITDGTVLSGERRF